LAAALGIRELVDPPQARDERAGSTMGAGDEASGVVPDDVLVGHRQLGGNREGGKSGGDRPRGRGDE